MTSVAELFAHAEVSYAGVVAWGDQVPLNKPGVYVVSTNSDPDQRHGLADCPLDLAALDLLLEARPEAIVDSVAATPHALAHRLRAMWPAGQPVVYIGLAGTDVQRRVSQFYRTPLGARAPHAGGWPVKMLAPQLLWVHYGPTDEPARAEAAMVDHFVAGISQETARALIDPTAPLPFANLTFPGGRRKSHGLRGFKASRAPKTRVEGLPQPAIPVNTARPDDHPVPTMAAMVRYTQNVTPADLDKGQLRIPRASKPIFPKVKARIEVELDGDVYAASWDPKTEGDRERSGTLRVGKRILGRYITAGPPRRLEATSTGYRIA